MGQIAYEEQIHSYRTHLFHLSVAKGSTCYWSINIFLIEKILKIIMLTAGTGVFVTDDYIIMFICGCLDYENDI